MKLLKKYLPGDKVFAKVRGYPPWPARVEGVTDPNTKNAKYKVFFYGTGETAVCKVEELFLYGENKEKYGKHLKRKIFHEGLQQLERELNNDQGKPETVTPKKEAVVESPEVEMRPAPEVPAAAVGLDSDLETGPLVIDESDKKKQLKRKSLPTPLTLQDSPEPKKKRGRGKSFYTADSTPKPESNDSIIEDTSKEVVSRSGRKIKPKRFADFSSSDEFDMENIGRARGRSKVDDSLEAPLTPSIPKKRISLEADKKEDKKASPKEEIQQKSKLRWLRMENQLLKHDAQIKSNLGLDRANTDECMEAMEEIMSLSIEPLMLKKHPHVVETVKRLRRYIGNVPEWKLTEDQVLSFKQKAEVIRQKAEHIYNKFKALFVIPEAQSFWQAFSDQVDQFKEATKGMKEERIFALMADPTSSEIQKGKIDALTDKNAQVADMDVDEENSIQTITTSK